MKSLKDIQQELSKAIRDPKIGTPEFVIPSGSLSASEAVNVYHTGHVVRLTDALGEAYKACWWVLGDDLFFEVCAEFIKETPSKYYDLSDYGLDFPVFLKSHKVSKEFSFLFDLAQFEWAFLRAFHGTHDSSFELSSALNEVGEQDFTVSFESAFQIVKMEHDITQIWERAHDKSDASIDLENLKSQTQLVLYNQNDQVFYKAVDEMTRSILFNLKSAVSFHSSINEFSDVDPKEVTEAIQNLFKFFGETKIVSGVKLI